MKNKIYALKTPQIITNLDGTNPREKWWGKFIRYNYSMGEDICYTPVFKSLWHGFWLKKNQVRKLYWWEHIEYFLKMRKAKLGYFVHYMKMAVKGLF